MKLFVPALTLTLLLSACGASDPSADTAASNEPESTPSATSSPTKDPLFAADGGTSDEDICSDLIGFGGGPLLDVIEKTVSLQDGTTKSEVWEKEARESVDEMYEIAKVAKPEMRADIEGVTLLLATTLEDRSMPAEDPGSFKESGTKLLELCGGDSSAEPAEPSAFPTTGDVLADLKSAGVTADDATMANFEEAKADLCESGLTVGSKRFYRVVERLRLTKGSGMVRVATAYGCPDRSAGAERYLYE